MNTESALNKDLILRENLAIERTDMAIDRTLLSFVRTALYFAIAGMTINSVLHLLWTVCRDYFLGSFHIHFINRLLQVRSAKAKTESEQKAYWKL